MKESEKQRDLLSGLRFLKREPHPSTRFPKRKDDKMENTTQETKSVRDDLIDAYKGESLDVEWLHEPMGLNLPIKIEDGAKIPTRGHKHDAGLDLYAHLESEKVINPGDVYKVHTGVSMAIPHGYFGQINERSSIGSMGIAVRGGVVDSTYRGEVIVCLQNLSRDPIVINDGDKIAQMVIMQCVTTNIEIVKTLDNTQRGDKGFGSTGN